MNELRELYIEPTSNCNLHCVMCSRNLWENETKGHMDLTLFNKLIDEIPDTVTRIFFGGIGEPLHHPDILYMLRRAKETGRTVEVITNGTLLDNEMSEKIVDTKLDMLWLSLDSLEEESYENIRSGAKFNSVMDNISVFNKIRSHPYSLVRRPEKVKVKLGIAFVLMKDNLTQFKMLLTKAHSLGIADVKATHLVPYDKSQINRICYERMIGLGMYAAPGTTGISVDVPLMDTKDMQKYDLFPFSSNPLLSFSITGTPLRTKENYCRFIEEGICFVRWDGEVCPCMALLHENTVYQQYSKRRVRPCSYGNANEKNLLEIWEGDNYAAFRQRVINFEFSPCSLCGPCDFFNTNEKDCLGNTFPTCGACLWAQGLFQCP